MSKHSYNLDLTKDKEINFDKNNLPYFATIVLNDNYFTKENKKKFKSGFLDKYLRYKKFREQVDGKFLFWLNKVFVGVIDKSDDTELFGKIGDDKTLVHISNNNETTLFSF